MHSSLVSFLLGQSFLFSLIRVYPRYPWLNDQFSVVQKSQSTVSSWAGELAGMGRLPLRPPQTRASFWAFGRSIRF